MFLCVYSIFFYFRKSKHHEKKAGNPQKHHHSQDTAHGHEVDYSSQGHCLSKYVCHSIHDIIFLIVYNFNNLVCMFQCI